MTAKDFRELAAQLALTKDELINRDDVLVDHSEARMDAWRQCVMAVMLSCRTTSANFDSGRFLTACGMANALGK